LGWSQKFKYVAYFDSCAYKLDKYGTYDCIVAVSNSSSINISTKDLLKTDAFKTLKEELDKTTNWLFGFLSYDLKNQIETLESNNKDIIQFPEMFFFKPEILFLQQKGKWSVQIFDKKILLNDVIDEVNQYTQPYLNEREDFIIENRVDKNDYLNILKKIRQDIINGTYYEINFCREFYAENVKLEPAAIFNKLNKMAEAPMSAFLKLDKQYALCASPERFLKKQGNKLIAQPMKGTCKRGSNEKEDRQLKKQLNKSIKERAENIMIVDLMRNDLTKSAKPCSIEVENLFNVLTFNGFHTMVSTVKSTLYNEVHLIDAIKNAFPIGSMTGAPKVKVMEHIEQYEQSKRGLYAGAIGYINPNGDFDFNVVIRSMLYDAAKQYLSFQTGGAIVYDSIAEEEYEETNLKAVNIFKVLLK